MLTDAHISSLGYLCKYQGQNQLRYPVDRDLSDGWCYPPFKRDRSCFEENSPMVPNPDPKQY